MEPLCTVDGNVNAATVGNSTDSPQKIENTTTMGSSYSTSGYLSKDNGNTNSERYLHPLLYGDGWKLNFW